ncbi:Ninja-family protein [Rhynchospora pubera]|uniref:Ninja-family protein n=1 Tax=Rhynchospora pubera TaxID=906938 RepID=A0AAV8C772_9POAL|nr:Ninja-family protein [Rhynchospora pubera]KAJ4796390.1 Ninja-family protein [Rhynchospora pubera]
MGESARDFLHQISCHTNPLQLQIKPEKPNHNEDSDEIELSLGLSLNGCFGVDPNKKTSLIRSSSIAAFPSLVAGGEHERPATSGALMRTSSLPAEEMQVLKRLEAKRKRLERRNSINKCGGGGKVESAVERCEEDLGLKRRKVEGASEIFNGTMGRVDFGSVVTGLKSQASSSSIDVAAVDVKLVQGDALSGLTTFSEQRSSEIIEASTEHQPLAAAPSLPARVSSTPTPVRKITGRAHSFSVVERNMLQEMPCVSTKGDGPNGKRVEGFLYKYKKGEEVRIVCVCHGRFLTPAEFVRHAGGSDVAHPLRHIVVSASPSACV